jgi:RNA polymerase sigma factor (sigma-70 family)
MVNAISDEELMLQVREGIGEMLGVLFDRYQQPLFSFFVRLTGDRSLSEDLVQDVFYRILRYRHTYKPGSAFRTWMYQVARNARHDIVTRQPNEAPLEEQTMQPATLPRDTVAEEQEGLLLRRALLALPEEKREVLLLSRFQELSYEEIGKLMGCDVGAVKVRVFRALQALKQIVGELQKPPGLRSNLQHGVRHDV